MPKKTGRERRAKRCSKKKVEQELIKVGGDHWLPTTEKEERQNNALIRRSLRWRTEEANPTFETLAEIEKQRAETDSDDHETKKELRLLELETVKKLRARDLAIVVTQRNMLSSNPMVSNLAVSNLIRMEGQNQADDHHEEGETLHHEHTVETFEQRRNRVSAAAKRQGLGQVVDAISCQPARISPPANGRLPNSNGKGH